MQRRTLYVDVDAARPAGICATNTEHTGAALAPEPERKSRKASQPYTVSTFDFHGWLASSSLEVAKEKAWGQGTVYELESCPWNPEHRRTARIVRFENGALSAGCFHDSCHGKGWRDLRAVVGGPALREQIPTTKRQHPSGEEMHRITVTIADVRRERVKWRWGDRIPEGKLIIIEGDPEVGKSFLALAVATAYTTGAALPTDAGDYEPQRVLFLTAEDGLADTVRPRLEDMGANLRLVTALKAVRDEGAECFVDLGEDLGHLEAELATGGYGLVIVDPINAYLPPWIRTRIPRYGQSLAHCRPWPNAGE